MFGYGLIALLASILWMQMRFLAWGRGERALVEACIVVSAGVVVLGLLALLGRAVGQLQLW